MDHLARACEDVARFNSRLKKIAILADYLRDLDETDLARAVRFLAGGPVFQDSERKLSVGYAAMRDALLAATGFDDYIIGLCYREVGDSGETVSLLMDGRTEGLPLSLAEAERIYARLCNARRTADKVELLRCTFLRHQPLALRYFVKIITGNLRIGLQEKMLEEAVAAATGVPHDVVRLANNRLGDLSRVAVAARRGEIDKIEARLFHSMEFMLAKPLERVEELEDPSAFWVEDKYDGIRSQVHFDSGRVQIFSRGMEDISRAFPEICEDFAGLAGPAVLDGEILAWREDRALSFNVLQQRLARKKVSESLIKEIPVAFVAYDLLYGEAGMTNDCPVEERRSRLEAILTGAPDRILVAPRTAAATHADIDRQFEDARTRGNEGLVLKRRGSVYEAGKRSGAWLKVKRAFGTLDVVITAAEQGHGRRATVLSDYTFAVRSESGFLNVGKAYSGLTDPEVRELTRILRSLATDRFGGRVLLVKPEVVLEVAFDGVQKSPRHKSGYALRFPRILRWRKDKTAAEADTIDAVTALYEASVRL